MFPQSRQAEGAAQRPNTRKGSKWGERHRCTCLGKLLYFAATAKQSEPSSHEGRRKGLAFLGKPCLSGRWKSGGKEALWEKELETKLLAGLEKLPQSRRQRKHPYR